MEDTLLFSCLAIIATLLLVTWKFISQSKRYKNLPPRPSPKLPVIGHLHLLMKNPLHQTLQKLSNEYGPIFSLSLGSRLAVVITSPTIAEECFTTNDIVFANHPHTLAGKYTGYNNTHVGQAPYGDHWRNLRIIYSEKILSTNRLKNFQSIRQNEVKLLLQSLFDCSKQDGSARVELKTKLSDLSLNVITRMIAGKRYYGDIDVSNKQEAAKFRTMIKEMLERSASTNPEELFPVLQWFDFRGLRKSLAKLGKRMDALFQGLLDDHRIEKRNTMISHLLALQESDPECYTDYNIKAIIVSLLSSGTDTSSTTIEWAMSALLNHPEVLERARNEIDLKVGHGRLVEESDLPNLPYIENIVLETYRLFPALPLLLPHLSSENCKVHGYDIPRGTMIFFNAWAIHRDPLLWDDPTSFRPERFEGKSVNPFELMPFGRGKRMCPGTALAEKVVGLTLASLIQCFDWKRISKKEEVNLDELRKGITLSKAEPLEAVVGPRDFAYKILSP